MAAVSTKAPEKAKRQSPGLKARAAAVNALIERYPNEYDALLEAAYGEMGLEYERKLTPEEKRAAKVAAQIAEKRKMLEAIGAEIAKLEAGPQPEAEPPQEAGNLQAV